MYSIFGSPPPGAAGGGTQYLKTSAVCVILEKLKTMSTGAGYMFSYKKAAAFVLSVAAALSLAGCGGDERHDAQLFSMDTAIGITAYGKNGEAGIEAAEGVITALDAMLEPQVATSTTWAINHSAGSGTVVTGQVAEMLQTAQTVYTRSGGALDLTVYPLVKAWGFVDGQYRVPSDSEITSLLSGVGFDKVSLSAMSDSDSWLVTLPAGTELSFACVGNGCAAKYAAQALAAAGVESGIISLGSNVQTLGLKPDGGEWSIAIQDPESTNAHACIVSVGESAVVTTGGYQRYFTGSDGTLYQHIIDPDTGRPVESDLLSVTVICEDGTMADALSTALYILGERGAENYYEAYGGFEMVLITDDGRAVVSSGLRDRFTESGGREVEYVRRDEG